jgi:glucose-6-phosphate isomerase
VYKRQLSGFFQGTRTALYESGRESVTITVDEVTPATVGALIALYERAVGLYASLINVNAYHQPGVEAGKKAAGAVLALQAEILDLLRKQSDRSFSAEECAAALARPEEVETVFIILRHLAANPDHGVTASPTEKPWETTFRRP